MQYDSASDLSDFISSKKENEARISVKKYTVKLYRNNFYGPISPTLLTLPPDFFIQIDQLYLLLSRIE